MNNNMTLKKMFPLFLVAFLLASPLSAVLAKDNNSEKERGNSYGTRVTLEDGGTKADVQKKEEKEKRKEDQKQEKGNKECLRAFGHLISFGWIKKNSALTAGQACSLPFGISKKFSGNASSTPPLADTIAPLISNIVGTPRFTDTTISWTTNEMTKGTVFFSTMAGVNVNSTSTLRVSEGFKNGFFKQNKENRYENSATIRGLAANTVYYAVIRAEDKAGNVTQSIEFSLTTKTPDTTNDTTAPTISNVATMTGGGTVVVGWITNEPATSKVFYSATIPVNTGVTTTSFVQSEALTLNHIAIVPNLATSTKYYFVAQSKDNAGNIQSTSEFSVTTK